MEIATPRGNYAASENGLWSQQKDGSWRIRSEVESGASSISTIGGGGGKLELGSSAGPTGFSTSSARLRQRHHHG